MQVFGDGVAAISLPDPDYDVEQGEIAIATGWGQTDPDDETLPDILQVCTFYQRLFFINISKW